jgi:tRNA threonylcarbamoyladenosine biosynthesis protein TsaB
MKPLILSIETATLAGSICVTRGAEVLATSSGDSQVSHSNTLLADIDAVLKEANATLSEIDAFAVATGPGSFTGLRIGIATVKALAETLGKTCVGIPTLAAIAHAAGLSDRTLALLPAGRGEVFAQSFSVGSTGVTPLDDAVHLPPIRTLERYEEISNLLLTGYGARVHLDRFREWATQQGKVINETETTTTGWRFVNAETNLATHIAILALARIEANDPDPPNRLQAIYVRPSDAELKKPAANQCS